MKQYVLETWSFMRAVRQEIWISHLPWVSLALKTMGKWRSSTLREAGWRDHPKLSTCPSPGPGAGRTTLSASWQLFNLFLKTSDGGPTASPANLRWCLPNLTDGKGFINFYPSFIILIFSSPQVEHIAVWMRFSFRLRHTFTCLNEC